MFEEIIDPRTVVPYSELLETVADLVNQHCQVKLDNGEYAWMDMALNANENAMDVLERLGVVRKSDVRGRYAMNWGVVEAMIERFGGQAQEHKDKGLADEQKKILMDHVAVCCGKLPGDYLENDRNLWQAFNAGRKFERSL